MKVLLLSTGIGPFPNNGWGACENLTADLAWAFQQIGVEAAVLHVPSAALETCLVPTMAEFHPDVVLAEGPGGAE